MRLFNWFILVLSLCVLNLHKISAQEMVHDTLSAPNDSLRASLITCTPGTDVYAHFGHTAIRLINFANGTDIVFNYGCFDSSQSDFVIKFIKGETDYVVDAEDGSFFFGRYHKMGNGAVEQLLNLTQDECIKLAELLFENIKPENRGYRYNWLYDNCTTRARDMIEKAINGKVVYEKEISPLTARDELHECLANNSWLELGIDLLLGTEIDTIAPRKIQQFIPAHYKSDLDAAYIINKDGSRRSMLADTVDVLDEDQKNQVGDTWITPNLVFCIILILAIILSIIDWREKRRAIQYRRNAKTNIWFDIILHIVQGVAGIIIGYLFFFSEHPAVDSNWQIIIFNPLFILYAIYLGYCRSANKKNSLAYVNLMVIILFCIVVTLTKQQINTAVYIITLTLLIRAISNLK